MPYLRIDTNQPLDPDRTAALMSKASELLAERLGKPRRYIMVALNTSHPMLFDASDAPSAFAELKSLGLPEDRTGELSEALCDLLQAELAVDRQRIFIVFASVARHMWGWNGATFG